MAEQTSSDEAEEQHAHKSEEGKECNPLPGFIIIALKISYFCLRRGLGKAECQQSTCTSCSTMQELQGQCKASCGSAFLGQKETVGQGCCGTWGRDRAGQESLQMWKQSQSLGTCRVWISIPEEEAWVQFWFEIGSFPSEGISGMLLQDKVLALGCCRNPEAPELPRGPWLTLCLTCSTKADPTTRAGTELCPFPWALFPWQKLPPGLHLSEVCALTLP